MRSALRGTESAKIAPRVVAFVLSVAAATPASGQDAAARPNQCPTVTLSADKTTVTVGETVTFTATAWDPDDGPRPLTYEWTTSAGSLRRVADGEVRLDTTGLSETITVSVTASDGDVACRVTKNVEIEFVLEGLWHVKLEDLYFAHGRARIDEMAKRILDDAAVRLEQDPTVYLVLDGNSETGERRGIALRRAENARRYLTMEKGIDPSRIVVRTFDNHCLIGASEQNRRVEIYILPQGRTSDEIEKGCP